jgi:hypothetical protein
MSFVLPIEVGLLNRLCLHIKTSFSVNNMLKRLINFFHIKTEQQYVEDYLAQSASLADLERRQRELRQRGYIA